MEDDCLVELEHHETRDGYDQGVEREEDDEHHEEIYRKHLLLDSQVAAATGAPDREAHAHWIGHRSV